MSFTQKETNVQNHNKELKESFDNPGLTVDLINVNSENPFADHDYGIIIQAFEREATNWAEEDYALAYHYKDVQTTQNFSSRVRKQMDYYPGMHQKRTAPEENPFDTEAKENSKETLDYWNGAMDNPDSFMNGLRSRQEDFDYTAMFDSEASAKDKATEFGKMITECIPCFNEILDAGALLPSGDLLEIHLMNIKVRMDILDKIKTLFNNPGAYIDVCQLLDLFTGICPRQLLAMIALLSQYLAKINLDIKFNIDFIIQLVGPVLSPFLDGLSQWLDMWTQLILGPMICVIDHVNEVIMLAQNMETPFAGVEMSRELNLNIAGFGHQNMSAEQSASVGLGVDKDNKYAGSKGAFDWQAFETPDKERYNPERPDYPYEETEMAAQEIGEAWKPSFSEEERQERNRRWEDLRATEEAKRELVPPPLTMDSRNGTKWSKDDIPNSEKTTKSGEFDKGNYPPEEQRRPGSSDAYFDPSALVNSVVQLRNILQGAVQYVNDWFTYVTQMIYDLIGTDIGWMSKKSDTTMIKSNIIQMIMMIKAIMQAIKKNGLKCGIDSNFDQGQLQYILEDELNNNPSAAVKFNVDPNGEISITQPGDDRSAQLGASAPTANTETVQGMTPDSTLSVNVTEQEKPVSRGTVIKNCFKNVRAEDDSEVRKWIADLEKRGNI